MQRIVFSFNFPLNLFLISKYSIRNCKIYPSGLKYRVFAFCFMLFTYTLCIFSMISVPIILDARTVFNYDLFIFFHMGYFFSSSIGFVILFILDIVHGKNNVLLILKIQTIHKGIDFSKNIRSFLIWNWISITILISLHIVTNIVFYNGFRTYDFRVFLDNMYDLLCIASDINFLIAIRIITLLRMYLDMWIEEIMVMNNERCPKLLEIYQNIFKAYNLYKKIFQVLVSL